MKIEKIETFFVSRFLVVKVTTEDGLEGIGESCYWSYPKAAEATIHSFSDTLLGMDSDDVEHIWNYLWRYNSAFRGNSIGGAISAIDMALWDIKGKRLQTPVWNLLGGKGGPYNCFAGIDCSRALAKVSLDPKDLNAKCADLYAAERDVLNDWVRKFEDKYPEVGIVLDGTYDGPP